MKPSKPPKAITDAGRLKALYVERSMGLTQKEFGKRYQIGSQGMVWQYLNDKAPLNPGVAMKFANALGVSISEFSPSLAKQVKDGQVEEIERIPMTLQIRPVLRREMQEILMKRNKGMRGMKAYELYEEAIAEFIVTNKHLK